MEIIRFRTTLRVLEQQYNCLLFVVNIAIFIQLNEQLIAPLSNFLPIQ